MPLKKPWNQIKSPVKPFTKTAAELVNEPWRIQLSNMSARKWNNIERKVIVISIFVANAE